MNIFNRKSKQNEEIENLNNNLNQIKNDLEETQKKVHNNRLKLDSTENSLNKSNTEIIELKLQLNEQKEYYKSVFEKYESQFLKLNKKMDILTKMIKVVTDDYTSPKKENKVKQTQKKNITETSKKHLYNIKGETPTKLYVQPLEIIGRNQIKNKSRILKFTIDDVISIKENLKYFHEKKYTITKIGELYSINKDTIARLIYNIEEGVFDEVIEKYTSINQKHDIKNSSSHFREIPPSLRSRLKGNFIIVNGGELLNQTTGRKTKYTIQDIIEIQKMIPDFKKYPTIEDMDECLDMSIQSLKTLIWRIEEGYFDELINEYLSRKYTYENDVNRLFIDNKNTGLTIDNCISIIECIMNSSDKREVVNNLIRMYPNVDSKYIRIIADEYNNPNLNRILKKEVKKIEKIDNPQKRRELGVYL